MKIAILTSGILPVPAVKGGAVENLTDFYLEYNDKHHLHDITVYSVDDDAVKNHPDLCSTVNHYHYIKVHGLWPKFAKRLFHLLHRQQEYYHYSIEYFLHQALRDIRKQDYDIVILENRPAYALKLIGQTKACIIYHLHNEKLHDGIPQYQEIYDAATKIINVSNYITSRVRTINSHDRKCETVYNGIDLQAFSTKEHRHGRRDIGLADDDFVIIFSGRVNQEKGIMELIKAMVLLKEHPHIKLLVIGSSFFGNADNKNEFAKSLMEEAAPLKDRILFTGFIPYSQMPGYLQMANLSVIPSIWDDPFPTTVLEAQAMGLPVIASRRGGIPEEVTDECAILLDTDDHFVSYLAQTILDLYQHPEKCKAMGEAAKKHSMFFNKERYAQDFFKAIENTPTH